ncbi:MAG: outer membrane protein assembly factor BamA [Deltaproteobacteria bacterium]|nr:outer membrane protein assembly factor BamA [Deltaproteobacteria bacterium]
MKRFSFTYFSLLISCIAMPLAADPGKIADVRIQGLTHLSDHQVRSVIALTPGEAWNPRKVDLALDHLLKWGVFSAVDIDTSSSPQGTVLTFNITEATVVTSIDIAGNYPLLENRIRRYLTLHVGDIASQEMMAEQVTRVEDFFVRQGFPNTQVVLDQKNRPEENGVDLVIRVHHGHPLRFGNVTIVGNEAYPKGRFITMLKTWKPFSEQNLRKSLRNLKNFYQEHGYPKIKISVREKQLREKDRRMDLSLDVQEGPHVKYTFVGNRRFRAKTLREKTTSLRDSGGSSFELEQSAVEIQELYRTSGYPNVQITSHQQTHKNGTLHVTFHIDEDGAQAIKRMTFKGAEHISSGKLEKPLANRQPATGRPGIYRPDEIANDTERIKEVLQSEGFLEANVGTWEVKPTPDGFANFVTIPLTEGPRTTIADIRFSGPTLDEKKLRDALKVKAGEPYRAQEVENDLSRLNTFFADHGHPYAEVKQTVDIDSANHTANIVYTIDPGQEVHIGEILIVGDVLTSQKAIKKAVDLKPGDLWNNRKVLQAELNIRRLGAFSSANVEPMGLTTKEPIVHLRVKVEEQPPFRVDLEAGYSTDHSVSGVMKFTNLNAFGWAKQNTLALTAGEKLSRAELGWIDPRFFNSSFEFSSSGWIQYKKRPAFEFSEFGTASGWFRRFRRTGLFFRVELARHYLLEGSASEADKESVRNNTLVRTSSSISFDTRNSFADPTRGLFLLSSAELINEIRGNEANFTKLSFSGEKLYSPLHFLTLATTGRFQRIETLGANVSVPQNELLFLGGDDTIRGFSEDAIGPVDANGTAVGGRTRWIFNEELRLRPFSHFSVAVFYDAGELVNGFDELSFSDARHSYGFGLRYLTPVGPLRADYGIKLDHHEGEDFGRFHFTFGYVF